MKENDDSHHGNDGMRFVRKDLTQYAPACNLLFNETVRELISKGKRIYHLAFGQSPFPVIEVASEALKEYTEKNDYLPVTGIAELRKGISEFHARYGGVNVDPDDVVVGPGSKQLIFLLFTVFEGDIMVLSPSWTTYKPQVLLSGHQPIVIDTAIEDEWRLTPEVLEKAIKFQSSTTNKLLVLCNPDNPTGTSYNESQLKSLSEVFRKHNILVLTDEIYALLKYQGNHAPLAKFYPEGTITSSGLSKWASAGGWRLGYNIFPPQLKALMETVKSAASHSHSCAPAPMQFAVAKMFGDVQACEDYIKHTRRIMAAVGDHCFRELTAVGLKAVKPTAGYYIFPDFEILREALRLRNILTCEQMCEAILEEASVAIMAGGPGFLRPVDEFTTRICYVSFDGGHALSQSRSIGLSQPLPDNFVRENCTTVAEGIEALANWVTSQLKSTPNRS